MPLILIHPEYQKGNGRCPACNARKGETRMNNMMLCTGCSMAALERDPRPETRRARKPRHAARFILALVYGITVIFVDIGYLICNALRVFRGPAQEQVRRQSGHMNTIEGRGHADADRYECNI